MKRNKNLQSGFTLVELIVVMALMAIVFGALMNIIKPTNKFFNDSEAFKDEVYITEGLTDALANEVRYSTNVVVLKDYVGVPKISADGKLSGIPDVKFDAAILVENDQVRGAYTSTFPANTDSTSARRKKATGQIVTFEVGGAGINFAASDFLYTENYYDDYLYEFTVGGNNDENGKSFIEFDVVMNDLVKDGDVYVSSEDDYKSKEYLYLTNINLKDNDGHQLIVKDFAGATDDAAYTGFERATANSGAVTDIQKALYKTDDASNVHTWIIYIKDAVINSGSKVKLTFKPGDGGTNAVVKEVKTGKTLNVLPPVLPESGYENYERDGNTYTRKFLGWYKEGDDTRVYTNDEMMLYTAMTDETFIAKYEEVSANYTVEFYDTVGNMIGVTNSVLHGDAVTPPDMSSSIPSGYTHYMWKIKGTANSVVDFAEFSNVTRTLIVEPYYYNKFTVTFYNEDGTEYQKLTDIISGTGITAPSVPEISGKTGAWYIKGTDTIPDFTSITADMEIEAKYTSSGLVIESHNLNYWNVGKDGEVNITVRNNASSAVSRYVITIPCDKTFTVGYNSVDSDGAGNVVMNGNNVVITVNKELAAGGSYSFRYQFHNATGELTFSEPVITINT